MVVQAGEIGHEWPVAAVALRFGGVLVLQLLGFWLQLETGGVVGTFPAGLPSSLVAGPLCP